jgi:tight adherence protein B
MGMIAGLSDQVIFVGMVFVAVFLLAQAFVVPTFGENRQVRNRMRQRLQAMARDNESQAPVSLVRRQYLRELSAPERWLESLPGMQKLAQLIEQAGRETPAYRVVGGTLLLGAGVAVAAVLATGRLIPGLLLGAAALPVPLIRLSMARTRRMALFEEQLPDALTIMARALRSGHPFSGALHLVSEELQDPVAREFGATFTEINYGGDVRAALRALLERMPSVTVMAFVTSVLIQKETGGNLAELLERLAAVVRERFRFHRKLRTLSAEGRLAAWILSLMPFVLAMVLSVVNPDLLPMMTTDPTGRNLVAGAFVLLVIGVLWLRRIVRIDV